MGIDIQELLESKRKSLPNDSDYIEELERLVEVGNEVEISQRQQISNLQGLLIKVEDILN